MTLREFEAATSWIGRGIGMRKAFLIVTIGSIGTVRSTEIKAMSPVWYLS